MKDLINIEGFVDRKDFPAGEWDDEPDLVVWVEPKTGYICVVARVRIGTLSGYVGIPEDHPAYGERDHFADVYEDVQVHSGVTFAQETPYIGHGVPIVDLLAIAVDDVPDFWIGFDCAHSGDIQPLLRDEYPVPGAEYRSLHYVRCEAVKMARSLWDIAHGRGIGEEVQ